MTSTDISLRPATPRISELLRLAWAKAASMGVTGAHGFLLEVSFPSLTNRKSRHRNPGAPLPFTAAIRCNLSADLSAKLATSAPCQ
jgi:hypothetical protein